MTQMLELAKTINNCTKYKYFKDVNENMDVIYEQIQKPSSAMEISFLKIDGSSTSEKSFF